MKLTIDIDYEECLKACLDYAKQKFDIFSGIIGKRIDINDIFGIMRSSANMEMAKSEISWKYGLQDEETALLLNMPLSGLAGELQERLDYFRTSVDVLSKLVGKKADTDNKNTYIELVTH